MATELQAAAVNPHLARYAGVSVAGFNRTFHHHFQTAPARYLSEMRVREAARLLLQTDATIDNIAETTGFPNRAYFSRVFQKVVGDSPARFRWLHGTAEVHSSF